VIDEAGVKLIHDWIAQLPGTGLVSDAPSQASAKTAAAVSQLRAASDDAADALPSQIDPLLTSTASALRLAHALGEEFPASVREAVVARASQSETAEVRDVFERFLPEERRVKRLGSVVRPEQILALAGDMERGRKVFFDAAGVQCRNCHRIQGRGTEVGPDLDQLGKKYSRAVILENILDPSRQIDPKYLTYVAETKAGQVHTGLLVGKTETEIVLKDANNKLIQLPAGDIDLLVPQQKSLMPDAILRELTAEQAADLTAFLSSLQ
jgi:putative heme-binding domain-containing protein